MAYPGMWTGLSTWCLNSWWLPLTTPLRSYMPLRQPGAGWLPSPTKVHLPSCPCLANLSSIWPKVTFFLCYLPWVPRAAAATAQQAGGQIQAVIHRERESLWAGVPAWGVTAGDLEARPSSVRLWSKPAGGGAEQQGTEVSRGEAGRLSFLWLHPWAGAAGRSGTPYPWVQGWRPPSSSCSPAAAGG